MKNFLKTIISGLVAFILTIKTIKSGNIYYTLTASYIIILGGLLVGILLFLIYKINLNLFEKLLEEIGFVSED